MVRQNFAVIRQRSGYCAVRDLLTWSFPFCYNKRKTGVLHMKLQGKTTLITGASGGIGSAIAKQFAREGLNLVLCGRSTEKLAAIRTT